MIRSWIKAGAAHVMTRTGLTRLSGLLPSSKAVPLVIGYHRVVEDFASSSLTSHPSMLVSREMLEQHLDWIGRRFRFVSLDQLGTWLETRGGKDDPVAAITFDDGYRDFYDHAMPVLQRKGIPAAVFVVTDLVGTKRVQIHDKLYLLLARQSNRNAAVSPYRATRDLIDTLPQAEIEKVIQALESDCPVPEDTCRPFYSLTWEMLDRIRAAGFTVGSHTRTHILTTIEHPQRVREELAGSRAMLEERLGIHVQHFAYPNGSFNTVAVDAVAAAGYRFGYTTCAHRDSGFPLLTMPRTLLWEKSSLDSHGLFSGPVLNCQINRLFDRVSGCRQCHTTVQESGHGRL